MRRAAHEATTVVAMRSVAALRSTVKVVTIQYMARKQAYQHRMKPNAPDSSVSS